MVHIRIISWDEEVAWTSFASYQPHDLERRLVRLTGCKRSAVKRLVKQLRDQACFRLPLPQAADRFAAESLRSLLESLGAAVMVEDT